MADELYVAVFEAAGAHLAYGAARLRVLPDLFGAGPKLTEPEAAKARWAAEALRPHDGFTRLVLGCGRPVTAALRLRLRPHAPEPLDVAYLFRCSGRTEEAAEEALQALWAQVDAAFPRQCLELEAVGERALFDQLFGLGEAARVLELQHPRLRLRLTERRRAEVVLPFAFSPLRWNELVRLGLSAGLPLAADVSLTPASLRSAEAQWLEGQAGTCEAVHRVTGAASAREAGALLSARLARLRGGAALARVAVASEGPLPPALHDALLEAFRCQAPFAPGPLPPAPVEPGSEEDAEDLLQAIAFLLPPVLGEEGAPTTRLPWLCGVEEAAELFRPPVLLPPEHPRLRFAVPPALQGALEKAKVVNVQRGIYIERGARVEGSSISADLHDETVVGDQVSGDKVGGDKIGGDEIVAGGKTTGEGRKAPQPHAAPAASPEPAPGEAERPAGEGRRCAHCGAVLRAAAKFCTRCGAPAPGEA